MSIQVKSSPGNDYKSISEIEWEDIPPFSILTGRNGAGKTQLLELLANHFAEFRPQGQGSPSVIIRGSLYNAAEIGFVPSGGLFSDGTHASVSDMASFRKNVVNAVQNRHRLTEAIQGAKVAKRLGLSPGHYIQPQSLDALAESLPEDFAFAIEDLDVVKGLAHVFVAYRVRTLEAIDRGTPGIDADGKLIGPAPWQVINDAFTTAGFAYHVISPETTPLMKRYDLLMIDRQSKVTIRAADLSSGEKVLCQLVLWLFTAGKDGVFPKLLLLDEPDAHLHPSMTMQFIDVIKGVLVERYGVRVIMTSHSPSTIALAPEGSIYEMERGRSKIEPIIDRSYIISILTAGLVTVSSATKYCFVEDVDDVEFYEALRAILSNFGSDKDPCALKPSPSIVFIPVSVGAGATKLAGGCTIVDKWIQKLDADALKRIFLGIRDRDDVALAASASDRIFVIGRYSIENYLLDPLNIFAALLAESLHPNVSGVLLVPGDEYLLRSQPTAVLQAIANTICRKMEATAPKLGGELPSTSVLYTRGFSIELPSWVLDFRGHDLLPIAQQAYDKRVITPPKLRLAWQRARLVTKELADIFSAVQKV